MMMMMPPSHCWRSGELRMLHAGPWVPMGAQLPPWCLFVSLDLKPYVTPEGFKPSRHKLGPGVDSARASHRSVPPMAPVQDSTSQKMISSRNAHSAHTSPCSNRCLLFVQLSKGPEFFACAIPNGKRQPYRPTLWCLRAVRLDVRSGMHKNERHVDLN